MPAYLKFRAYLRDGHKSAALYRGIPHRWLVADDYRFPYVTVPFPVTPPGPVHWPQEVPQWTYP